jgi:FMN-dependent NADH-azoreductase
MTHLLHISASPRGSASESLQMAEHFLDAVRDARPDVVIDTFDLWDGTLPEFGPAATAAKMTVFAGQTATGEQAAAWQTAKATFERFAAADAYLFTVPMWNHGVPYILKQFIDVVSQPGMVFGFDPEAGYSGLLNGKKAAVIYTSAVYGPGRAPSFGEDFQAPYLNSWLRWTGIDDITTVEFRPNLATADADTDRQRAHAAARDAGRRFALPSRQPTTERDTTMTSTVTRTDLQALLAAGTVTVVDALPQSYYDQEHLPGALNLVEDDVDSRAAGLLPDVTTTIVTYCSNPACGNSKAVARRLEKLGYTDVRTYPGGIQDWVEAGLPTQGTSATTAA